MLKSIHLKTCIQIVSGIFLLFVCSQLSLPLKPVPITMQTVAVMLIALMFQTRIAIVIVLLYLVLGACGLPVFADLNRGLKILLGPTGGYLWGFLAAVCLMGKINKHINTRSFLNILLNCLSGTFVILVIGMFWLAHYIGLEAAIHKGFYPFIVPGLIKIFIAGIIFYVYELARTNKKPRIN